MKDMLKLAVITPEKPCPGMNAFMLSLAGNDDIELWGILDGWLGFGSGRFSKFSKTISKKPSHCGGSFLGSGALPGSLKDTLLLGVEHLKDFNGLIILGQETSLRAAQLLNAMAMRVLMIPTVGSLLKWYVLGTDSVLSALCRFLISCGRIAELQEALVVMYLSGECEKTLLARAALATGVDLVVLQSPSHFENETNETTELHRRDSSEIVAVIKSSAYSRISKEEMFDVITKGSQQKVVKTNGIEMCFHARTSRFDIRFAKTLVEGVIRLLKESGWGSVVLSNKKVLSIESILLSEEFDCEAGFCPALLSRLSGGKFLE